MDNQKARNSALSNDPYPKMLHKTSTANMSSALPKASKLLWAWAVSEIACSYFCVYSSTTESATFLAVPKPI